MFFFSHCGTELHYTRLGTHFADAKGAETARKVVVSQLQVLKSLLGNVHEI